MELYHISDNVYEVGQVIDVRDFGGVAHYHSNAGNNQWIDDYLSEVRPENAPDRKLAIDAFEEQIYCELFGRIGQRLYKVEMDVKAKCPLCLVGMLENNRDNTKLLDILRKEY